VNFHSESVCVQSVHGAVSVACQTCIYFLAPGECDYMVICLFLCVRVVCMRACASLLSRATVRCKGAEASNFCPEEPLPS